MEDLFPTWRLSERICTGGVGCWGSLDTCSGDAWDWRLARSESNSPLVESVYATKLAVINMRMITPHV